MGAEPGFVSSHTATTGTALVQTTPHLQARNGETAVTAGQLMALNAADGKAYLCDLASPDFVPAGFAATDNPLDTTVDDTAKVTLVREGRIRGFTGLIPGALYHPSADTAGAIVPERTTAGPVITAVAETSGTDFLRAVTVRAGHRPAAGDWTFTFASTTSCAVTDPDGVTYAATTVAADTAYDGTITGAADFYIETRTLTAGDVATVTVAYDTRAAAVITIDSPGNAFSAVAAMPGAAALATPGVYKLVTTTTSVTVGFNGSAQSAAKTIAAGEVYYDIIPGFALTTEAGAVTAETNYYVVGAQSPAAPVGMAVDASTLQILMGGIG